ncbi:bifunctional polysaccharide deacetylase/glycosyltransferase family 2 protein [Actinomadura scrupuli]|uniref:bifunctional polysaccharide deacetylase/glycosyltransferase family 2 protein n=1 Tax=Actinomadura scrupuli TaxID=559629 RepID=UPI003D9540CF
MSGRRARKRDPRSHWFLLVLAGLAFTCALLLEGFAHGAVGEAPHHAPEGGPAPAEVTGGGPVLNVSGPNARSLRIPAKTVALTFDDGPDPKWTPQILEVLRRHGAHATFFAIGAHVAENPALTRRILREGNELGSHTYTHLDMADSSAWRNRLELDLTQRALAGAAGVKTRLMRMPYSSVPSGLTAKEWAAARQAGADGYVVVLADRDTDDWARPGVAKIVNTAVTAARKGQGGVVMLHDSGGDRTQTVLALDQILDRLHREGYRVTTLSDAAGLPAADVPAGGTEKLVGATLVTAQRLARWLTGSLQLLFLVAGVLCVLRLALLVGSAQIHVRRVRRGRGRGTGRWPPAGPPPPVSVIVPAYNEEAGIAATVASLLDSDYPGPVEVLVVDDGSTDRTAEIVERLIQGGQGGRLGDGTPAVRLIRKPNGGKPSALNLGVAYARADVLVLVDGDTVFQRDTIGNLIRPLADPAVGAVSGNTKVANRGGLIGRWQHIEYVIGFNLDRRMFDVLQCMPTIPGAIGAFRRQALTAVGGVSDDTLAEDTDLTMAICRSGWRVVYEETALAWTEAPATLRQLWRQRYRWCYGTLQAMWKHRRSLVQSGQSGRFGRRCLTYLWLFQVALPLIAPAIDLFAVYGLIFLDPWSMLGTWALFVGLQVLCGAYALRLDHEPVRPLWTLPVQQIVYRQLMYLVVIQSLVTALLGARLRWHAMHRSGTFTTPDPAPAPTGAPVR